MARKVGDVILEVSGKEYEVISVSYDDETGRKAIDVMSASQNPNHYSVGAGKLTGSFEAAIPADGSEPDWRDIVEGRLVVVDPHGQYREAVDDVYITKVSSKYQAGEKAARTVEFSGKWAGSGKKA